MDQNKQLVSATSTVPKPTKTLLITGGSGLLGTELQKRIKSNFPQFDVYAPSHKEFDITKLDLYENVYTFVPDIVIHCAAYTDLIEAEKKKNRQKVYDLNVRATDNLVMAFPNSYFIHISTEYVYNYKLNYYSYTKKLAEEVVKRHRYSLIIRTLFKPRPFPHPNAFEDQYTRGDYVNVIAPMILHRVINGDVGIANIGTERKTMLELAQETRPDARPISVDSIKGVKLPKDYLTA